MNNHTVSPTKRLRQLLSDDEIHIAPAAYNPLTARLIERAGFQLVGTTGYGMSADLMGKPDLGLMTRDLLVTICSYMADAVSIPILADAESGYGNAIGVWNTVRAMEKAGVAGLFIEDLKHMGYKILSFPLSVLYYTTKQTQVLLEELYNTKSDETFADQMTTHEEFLDIIGGETHRKMGERFMPDVPQQPEH